MQRFFLAKTDPQVEALLADGNQLSINVSSLVESNSKVDRILQNMIKGEHFEVFKPSTQTRETLRKAKLSNQFGSICMQSGMFEKAGKPLEQAI